MFKNWSKTDRKILLISALLFLLSAYFMYDDRLLFLFDESTDAPEIGHFASTERDVRQKNSRRLRWRPVFSEQSLHLGDSVFTGPESSAQIALESGGNVDIPENSLITFSKLGDGLSLDLKFGSIAGEINGDLKIKVNGEELTLSGNKSKFELDANGSIRSMSGPLKVAPPKPIQKPLENKVQTIKLSQLQPTFFHSDRSQNLNISWKPQGYFSRYRVQLSEDPKFADNLSEIPTQNKSLKTKSYPKNGKLYVRVQGDDINGKVLAVSDVQVVDFKNVDSPLITEPKADSVIAVQQNYLGKLSGSTAVEVKWSYPLQTKKFEVEISKEQTFETTFTTASTPGKNLKTPELPAGKYYIRVRDQSLSEIPGPWSPITSVEIKIEKPEGLAAPEMELPEIKHVLPKKAPPQIRWKPVPQAQKYQLKILEKTSQTTVEQQTLTKTKFDWTNHALGQYEVKVTAIAPDNSSSPESLPTQLSVLTIRPTLNPVEPKTILGKSPEDPGDPQEFDLSWKETPKADKYEIQISENAQFDNPKILEVREPASKVTVEKPGDYFWRVKPLDNAGRALTRPSEKGTIKYDLKVPLATPILVEPLNDITYYYQKTVQTQFWFEWEPVRQANRYIFEISTEPSFTAVVFRADTTKTRLLVNEKLPEGPLYWRVQAQSDGDRISNWSQAFSISLFSGRIPAGRR